MLNIIRILDYLEDILETYLINLKKFDSYLLDKNPTLGLILTSIGYLAVILFFFALDNNEWLRNFVGIPIMAIFFNITCD